MDTRPMGIVDTAMRLALEHHHGVVNKHDGEPYILHVHRVASNFGDDTLDDQIAKAIAWLHDAMEDENLEGVKLTGQDIATALSGRCDNDTTVRILNGVHAMTKVRGESNTDYYWRVKRNADATRVKIADILDNFGRNHNITDEATKLRMAAKYSEGLDILCRRG